MRAPAFDRTASAFDHHRVLPDGVAAAVREAVLTACAHSLRPRLLDLGAGTGRFGQVFLAAGDDYVGVDSSFGMLEEFSRRRLRTRPQRLVQADGVRLPFLDATFDAVMLMHVLSGVRQPRRLLDEARRVLRPSGVLILGRTIAPPSGLDARMKERLRTVLNEMDTDRPGSGGRGETEVMLVSVASRTDRVVAATWSAERTPRAFIERQRTGARFSTLPPAVQSQALEKLSVWATKAFVSLDRTFAEEHSFELKIFQFNDRAEG